MKKEKRDHESFLILKDHEKYVQKLNHEEVGKLFLALFAYADRKEVPDFYNEDQSSRLSMTFEIMTDTIDTNATKYAERCEKNKKAGRKGGIKSGETRRERSKRSECFNDEANEADNDIDTVTVNDTESVSVIDTVTDTDSEDTSDSESSGEPGPLPDGGPAPEADLFTFDQLKKKRTAGKVNLSDEGISVFLEDMQADDWTMYGEPVEKRLILRTLREWANKHPEYSINDSKEDQRQAPANQRREPSMLEKAATIWQRDYASDRDPCKMLSTWRYHIGNKLLDLMIRNDVSEGDIICFCFCLEDAGLPAASGSGEISGFYDLFNQYNDLYKWICENWNDVFRIIGKNYDSDAKYNRLKEEYFKLLADKDAEPTESPAEPTEPAADIEQRITEAKSELQRRLEFDGITEAEFLNYVINGLNHWPAGTTISDILESEKAGAEEERYLSGNVFPYDNGIWGTISSGIRQQKRTPQ